MHQVIVNIPFTNHAVYGYGLMLVVAMFAGTILAAREGKRQGFKADLMWDLATWVLLSGILGARLFFVIQYRTQFEHWWEFLQVWRGGLVIYGGALGAFVGFLLFTARHNIRRLWLLDLLAPMLMLGMAFGRIGCLLNGCCYGDYSQAPWAISFPAGGDATNRFIAEGFQTRFGFGVEALPRSHAADGGGKVAFVDPASPAAAAGIRVGDVVTSVKGKSVGDLWELLLALTPSQEERKTGPPTQVEGRPAPIGIRRGASELSLTLTGASSLPTHPTQAYSAVGAFCLFLFLRALYPLRKRDGEIIASCVMSYSIGRFLIEFLRYDEKPLIDGLTISQNISVLMFFVGLVLLLVVRQSSVQRSESPFVG